ncbi:unnamed protein product [Echinostoma caproni]|uniref:Metallophos domain-containing protein n=1 Tax=Echinostoma caproni TaxID=27848 RepID=A0A183AQM1_9TREM|nr:unnamed protein product [Echinostoma caproni]
MCEDVQACKPAVTCRALKDVYFKKSKRRPTTTFSSGQQRINVSGNSLKDKLKRNSLLNTLDNRIGIDVILEHLNQLSKTDAFTLGARNPELEFRAASGLMFDYTFTRLFKRLEYEVMHTFQPVDDGSAPLLFDGNGGNASGTSSAADKQSLIAQYEQKLTRQEQELNSLRSRVGTLEQELSNARIPVKPVAPNHNLSAEHESLKDEVLQLRSQLAAAQDRLRILEERAVAAEQAKKTIRAEQDDLLLLMHDQDCKLERMRAQIRQLGGQVEDDESPAEDEVTPKGLVTPLGSASNTTHTLMPNGVANPVSGLVRIMWILDKDEVRILLVADPHVQVYHSLWYYLEFVAIVDSDWYLRRYFDNAIHWIQPSLVVFLGDLIDEGSTAPTNALFDAFDRFERIFMRSGAYLPTFLVPGDNDVGGEREDQLTEEKMARFRAHFVSYPRTRRVEFVRLFVDPLNTKWISPRFASNQSELISVFVSHFPMVTPYGMDPSPSLLRSEPSLIINGHDHVVCACMCAVLPIVFRRFASPVPGPNLALHMLCRQQSGRDANRIIPPEGHSLYTTPFRTDLNRSLHNGLTGREGRLVQFGVPSCSYRSGHSYLTAYGLLRLYRNRTVTYQLLALPNRWTILLCYACLICFLIVLRVACTKRRLKCWLGSVGFGLALSTPVLFTFACFFVIPF